ncbi:hypothetical protein CRG98_021848 [Punica granatum]|uniref:Uncharacterized protein n=1 Tax=Punica granatum TaxID=22663 RepID=A0A2I0JNF2_PUNGR|nr:hypothetical protein CRG98_021848 [Punica granatum]
MERPVGFEEEGAAAPGSAAPEELPPAQSVLNFRTVPWLSWDEWDHVRFSLFSSSPDAIEAALIRVSNGISLSITYYLRALVLVYDSLAFSFGIADIDMEKQGMYSTAD